MRRALALTATALLLAGCLDLPGGGRRPALPRASEAASPAADLGLPAGPPIIPGPAATAPSDATPSPAATTAPASEPVATAAPPRPTAPAASAMPTTAPTTVPIPAFALDVPVAVAFDAQGRLLVAERGRHRIVRLGADGAPEPVAGGTEGFAGDGGPATAARFSDVAGLAARGPEVFVIDAGNGRLRRIDAAGVVTTLAGGLTGGGSIGDRLPTREANLRRAMGLAVDPNGWAYWCQGGVRQVQRLASPDEVELVVGVMNTGGLPAAPPGHGEAAVDARLRCPLGLAFLPGGDLLVADAGDAALRRVTGLDTIRPTIADGSARDLALVGPAGLCVGPDGSIWVGELGTKRPELPTVVFGMSPGLDLTAAPVAPRIRRIAPDGTVTVVAGPGGRFLADPDAPDALVMPAALALSADGRLAVADPGANAVRVLPIGDM